MKKLNYFLIGAAALTLASCSNKEEVAPAAGTGDGNFHVNISLPNDLKSRAVSVFGDGLVATQLNFAVYDAASNTLVDEGLATFPANSLSTTVDFNLAIGKSYNIAFFAQSEASAGVYTFSAENKTMTVDYSKMTSANNLNDAYDCFYNVLATGKIGSSQVTKSVVLNRPVGQVNWATDDLVYDAGQTNAPQMGAAHDDAYGENGQYIVTNLTIEKAYTVLNLLDGTVSGNNADVTIKAMAAPYQVTFPLADVPADLTYTYVSMSYVLAPAKTPTLYNLNLNIGNDNNPKLASTPALSTNTEVGVSNVNVQANYQTNIYGTLLSENVSVTVTKNKYFETPSYDYEYPQE